MTLALVLSVGIGIALGLLGGGGSILTVPILVYAAGLGAKPAIATSLLVVGVTSAAALISHARAGRVRWKTGALFGAAGMAGAYGGGHLAALLPGWLLLTGFGALMLTTALAMLRGRRKEHTPAEPAKLPIAKILVEGAIVGMVTGMVGAGGGFLVVPALVILSGLPMSHAVGTSLLVITMKSFAGFAGYLGHVDIDWALAAGVTGTAVAGSLIGARLARYVKEDALRQVFAWFVIVMGVGVLAAQLPAAVRDSSVYRAVLLDRWPWFVGGAAIGAFVLFLLWIDNKLLGVSTGCADLCNVRRDRSVLRSWRTSFLGGILLGGVLATLLAHGKPTLVMSGFDAALSAHWAIQLPLLLGAGFLIGYGARRAGGCTSGHSIVGVALRTPSSMIATAAFLAGGFATTAAVAALFG